MPVIYKNRLMRLEVFKDKTEGKERCRVIENDVVVILAFVDDKHILIEKHYRAPIGKWVLELPAGHVEKGETPRKAAKKELLEETGYTAKNFRLLYRAYTAPGILTTMAYTYLATGLTKMHRTDIGEMLIVRKMALNKIYKLIKSNALVDKKTIAGVLYYKEFFSQ